MTKTPTQSNLQGELVNPLIAPILFNFASWLLRRAQHNGVRRLYFAARDGQLLYKVAKCLAPRYGNIDCRYLFISRQALYLPSIKVVSPTEMPWLIRPFEQAKLNQLLAKLGLSFAQLPSSYKALVNQQADFQLKNLFDWNNFWKLLTTDPILSIIEAQVKEQNAGALQYFEQEGLVDAVPWALVDLGWHLTCQRALKSILNNKTVYPIRGYYLELHPTHVPLQIAGMAEGLFNHQIRNQHQYKTNLLEHILFLEAVLGCADHQSVHHYTIESGESKPVFLPNSDEQLQSLAVRIHPLVIQWVEQQGKQDHTDDKIRENIDKTFARFCANASPSSLKALEPIQITYDQNGLHKIPLIQEYNLLTALAPLFPRSMSTLKTQAARGWPTGSAAISKPGVKHLASCIIKIKPTLRKWRGH